MNQHVHCLQDFSKSLQVLVNWASEASPTLGCSIEILRDIYICMSVCLRLSMGNTYKKLVCKMRGRNYVFQTRACSKSVLLV